MKIITNQNQILDTEVSLETINGQNKAGQHT